MPKVIPRKKKSETKQIEEVINTHNKVNDTMSMKEFGMKELSDEEYSQNDDN